MSGAIVTPHRLATQAGESVLARGGNAVEAIIAATATLAVGFPHMCGLGGDSVWLLRDSPTGHVRALLGTGQAAQAASIERYVAAGHRTVPFYGPWAAATVPGAVGAWDAAWHYAAESMGGNGLQWGELLADAHEYAAHGARVSSSLARTLRALAVGAQGNSSPCTSPEFRAVYCHDNGTPFALGEPFCQPQLARSLEILAEDGAASFYTGRVAQTMLKGIAASGGLLTARDFAAYTPRWAEPLRCRYRDKDAFAAPPPSQGHAWLEIMQLCEHAAIGGMGEGSADYWHYMAEAVRLAFADRNAHLTDPDCRQIPMDELLDPQRAATRVRAIRMDSVGAEEPAFNAGGDTVWVGCVDGRGNAVSMLQSLYHPFGSGLMAGESGILLQNRACAFSLDPGHVNCLAPGKRSMHTLCPGILCENDKLWAVLGSMGGDGQPQTLAALATRLLDFGESPQQAVDEPRWLFGRAWGADVNGLRLEGRVPQGVVSELRKRGHAVSQTEDYAEIMGHAGVIRVHADGTLESAADPRGDGCPVQHCA